MYARAGLKDSELVKYDCSLLVLRQVCSLSPQEVSLGLKEEAGSSCEEPWQHWV